MRLCLPLLALSMAAQEGVNFYTVEKERALGQQYASEVRTRSQPVDHPVVSAYVRRTGTELVRRLGETSFEYQFEVISGTEQTEPMALPGGYIFVPVQFITAARDEAEFAGMLAHVIAHVALRHGTRSATRAQVIQAASIPLVFMGGWMGSHADTHGEQKLVPAAFLEFQRNYEIEADRFGVELARRAGYDADGLRRYVERVQRADAKVSPLPARGRRLARLKEAFSSMPRVESSGEEFRRVQEIVRERMAN